MSPCPTPPAMGWSRAPIAPDGLAPLRSSPDAHAGSAMATATASGAASQRTDAANDFVVAIFILVHRDGAHHKRCGSRWPVGAAAVACGAVECPCHALPKQK